MNTAAELKRAGRGALGLLFPNACPLCDRIMPLGADPVLCEKCSEKVVPVSGDTCMKCGRLLSLPDREYCTSCSRRNFTFKRNFLVFLYEDEVREMIIKLKYKSRRDIAQYFAEEAYKKYGRELNALKLSAVVSVPVHKSRLKKRGYNQAAAIASGLADRLDLPSYPDVLIRTKHTTAQKQLGFLERMSNLADAFDIDESELARAREKTELDRVLLVDDILTTGSTLECAARVLKKYGVKEVYCLTACGTRGE